jgi:hypothetical protein
MRIVKWFIVSIALALIIIYFTGDYIARKILHYGLEYAEPELARHGITIKQFDYSKALLYSTFIFNPMMKILTYHLVSSKMPAGKEKLLSNYMI